MWRGPGGSREPVKSLSDELARAGGVKFRATSPEAWAQILSLPLSGRANHFSLSKSHLFNKKMVSSLMPEPWSQW